VEYALILIGLLGVYLVTLNFYVDRVPFLTEDFRRMVTGKLEALRFQSLGYFLSSVDGNVSFVLVLPRESNLEVSPDFLKLRVKPWENYDVCGDVCEFLVLPSPFAGEKNLSGVALIEVYSSGGEVYVK